MRKDNRAADALRPVNLEKGFQPQAWSSLLITMGGTQVVCAVTLEESVPPFLRGQGRGWITAEYGMLPCSASSRMPREAAKGRSGRTFEIQRLLGRSLRAMIDLASLGERTLRVDCDVLKADGGTRTASISGAWVALRLAVQKLIDAGAIKDDPLTRKVAAISCGIHNGTPVLDLDYIEDSSAGADANFVLIEGGHIAEVQATAEGATYDEEGLLRLLRLARIGCNQIFTAQDKAVAR